MHTWTFEWMFDDDADEDWRRNRYRWSSAGEAAVEAGRWMTMCMDNGEVIRVRLTKVEEE